MTVRIETTSQESKTIVSVAGRLAGPAVRELLKTCRTTGRNSVLDLSGLRSAEPDGIEAIQKLVREGHELRGTSPFIRFLLDETPPPDADGDSRVN
jgi:hypothetical protein